MNPDDVSSFMSSPVKLDTVTLYPVNPYGSGIAPFFNNLALWVCGFILMAIVRLRVDPAGLPRFSATQAYFGRWLFYVSIGIIQSLIICIGDLVLGIQCENPAAFIGAGVLAGFVYVNLLSTHSPTACVTSERRLRWFCSSCRFLDRQVCSPSR